MRVAYDVPVDGDPYDALVTHGAGRGSQLGFPTANLEAIDTLLPALGVYAGRAWSGGASSQRIHSTGGGTRAAFDPITNLRVGVQVLKECIEVARQL